MKYTRLGKSDLQVSAIGFGCMSLKGSQAENKKILHKAIDLGINYFDTADLYDKGMNEISVGKALKSKRDQLIIASKVGNQWRTDGSGWDWNPTKAYILRAVEDSLKRLQTEYLDLYQLHGGTIGDPIEETIDAFETLVRQGKIRYYGISSIRPNVIKKYISISNITSVMIQYSLLDRRPEEACLSLLHDHQVGVLARGSVGTGLLVDKTAKNYLGYSEQEVKAAAASIKTVSEGKRTAAQTAIQFVLDHPAVSSTVVGIRTTEHLKDAIGALTVPMLNESEKTTLRQSIPANFYTDHRE